MAIFDALPPSVSIYEVSPRDGLQNESAQVATHAKVRLIEALIEAGLKRIEVTSFVSAKWVPQMADADQVCRMVEKPEGVCFSALVPNARGLDRALAGGIDEAAVFLSASETHNRKNVNKSVAATLLAFDDVIAPARRAGMQVRGYVSTVWGCPYEGAVDPEAALRIAHELLSRGCYQVSLGDTIGVGTPLQTRRILEVFLREIPAEKIALHLHDTRGTALANVLVGLEMGITTYDSSVGGLGGCPYAPGAAGNLATEDLAYTLAGMGVDTGLDLEKIWRAGQVAEAIVGRELPGKVHKAGIRSLAH
ncbi:MAG: hydroxymethylglutaryl-CoA lyase [Sandaracinaceae bacterium]|nr:hydroxymethylglutaryl-CoA lyase [Sandaracinaceae bacterium]